MSQKHLIICIVFLFAYGCEDDGMPDNNVITLNGTTIPVSNVIIDGPFVIEEDTAFRMRLNSTDPSIRIFFFVNNPDKISGQWHSGTEDQRWFVENSGNSIINQCAFPYCFEFDHNGSIFIEEMDEGTYRIIADIMLLSKMQELNYCASCGITNTLEIRYIGPWN